MKGLKCELTSITPPKKLTHIVMNTFEKGRTKNETIEKVILGKIKLGNSFVSFH
jgi:hypothetical protein